VGQTASYVWLGIAVVAEIVSGNYMKESSGFRDVKQTLLAFIWLNVTVSATIVFLNEVDLSIGWALYTAFEFTGVVAVGVALWGEPVNVFKVLGLCVTLLGVVVLILEDEGYFDRMEASLRKEDLEVDGDYPQGTELDMLPLGRRDVSGVGKAN